MYDDDYKREQELAEARTEIAAARHHLNAAAERLGCPVFALEMLAKDHEIAVAYLSRARISELAEEMYGKEIGSEEWKEIAPHLDDYREHIVEYAGYEDGMNVEDAFVAGILRATDLMPKRGSGRLPVDGPAHTGGKASSLCEMLAREFLKPDGHAKAVAYALEAEDKFKEIERALDLKGKRVHHSAVWREALAGRVTSYGMLCRLVWGWLIDRGYERMEAHGLSAAVVDAALESRRR